MESKKFKTAKDVTYFLAALASGLALALVNRAGKAALASGLARALVNRAGKLEVKEEIAKRVEDKKVRDENTFVVEDTPIDIRNI